MAHTPVPVQVTNLYTPLPVSVTNFPSDAIEIWTLRVAVVALVVAAITLVAVLIQIWIANKEMGYVKTDLENNQRQLAEFFKRPKLSLRGSRSLSGGASAAVVNFFLYVSNEGDRGSERHALELLVPLSADARNSGMSHNDPNARIVGGVPYYVVTHNGPFLFPNRIPYVHRPSPSIFNGSFPVTFLWRMYDEYTKYPLTNYGTACINASPLDADITVEGNGPSDDS